MSKTPCIFCKPMNAAMRPYRKLSAYLASLPFHAKAFRFVAKIGPVAWLGALPILGGFGSAWVAWNVTDVAMQAVLGVVGMAFFLWLTLFWFVVPDASNPGILCNVKPGRALSAHLEGDMSDIDLGKGAASALDLAREIGARKLDLYSPLFGRAEKEKAWLRWLQKQADRLAPGAKVEVVHRKPLNWYVSFAYRCQYGENARATFKDGRVQAACFRITGF
jgi:hypothetical protein